MHSPVLCFHACVVVCVSVHLLAVSFFFSTNSVCEMERMSKKAQKARVLGGSHGSWLRKGGQGNAGELCWKVSQQLPADSPS